jgi:phosphoglucosamine mutase
MGRLFGTDGIRGEANRYPMDAATAFAVGQAMTRVLKHNGHVPRVIIGKDTRISGYMLESALESGVTSMGGYAYLVGVMPTPAIAYLTESMRADAGLVISASHNPYHDNGIKAFAGNGSKLSDDQEAEIEELVLGGALPEMVPPPKGMGRAKRLEDALGRYVVFLKNTFPRGLTMEGLKIAMDVANGATYKVAPAAFTELGAEVTIIHDEPNGFNINDGCGSQHTEDLSRAVRDTGSVIGLAFDGDGDRLIAVDEKGNTISGDQILLICAKMLQSEGRLANDLLVTTVMSNLGLRVAAGRAGIRHHASKVGDRNVLEDMRAMGAVLGGEDSGHVIFLDYHTTGDGILTALQLIAAMLKDGRTLSEMAAEAMDVFPQRLINVRVARKPDLCEVPDILAAVAVAEAELADQGRVLIRYSGTESLCRVMVEGPTAEITDRWAEQLAEVVRVALGG